MISMSLPYSEYQSLIEYISDFYDHLQKVSFPGYQSLIEYISDKKLGGKEDVWSQKYTL